ISLDADCLANHRLALSHNEEPPKLVFTISDPPTTDKIIILASTNDTDIISLSTPAIQFEPIPANATETPQNYNYSQTISVRGLGQGRGRVEFRLFVGNVSVNPSDLETDPGLSSLLALSSSSSSSSASDSSTGKLVIDSDLQHPLLIRVISSTGLVEAADWILLVSLSLFGFAIGCSLPLNTVRTIFKDAERSKGVAAAWITQFLVLPPCAFLLTKYVFRLSDPLVLGAVILTAAPGGYIAPIFTFFVGGDVPLSVSIGIIATFSSTFTFPLMVLISHFSFERTTYIPILQVLPSLAAMLVPVILGSITLHFQPQAAYYIDKTASLWGTIVLGTSLVLGILTWKEYFFVGGDGGWEVYAAVVALGVLSLAMGAVMSVVFRVSAKSRRAVFLQTSLQNTPLALSVIHLSFPANACASSISLLPLFYSLYMVLQAVGVSLFACYCFPTIKEDLYIMSNDAEGGLEAGTKRSGDSDGDESIGNSDDTITITKIKTKDSDTLTTLTTLTTHTTPKKPKRRVTVLLPGEAVPVPTFPRGRSWSRSSQVAPFPGGVGASETPPTTSTTAATTTATTGIVTGSVVIGHIPLVLVDSVDTMEHHQGGEGSGHTS
ncbi:hypothetical protein HK102_004069, partial [Quaeritorhiza haematococci]